MLNRQHKWHLRSSSTPQVTPATLIRGDRGRLPAQHLLAGLASIVLCAMAIAAIWTFTNQQIAQQRQKVLGHAEDLVQGQTNLLAETARQELTMIDQSLTVLQEAWNSDPAGFNLKSWQLKMPALAQVAKDIFIADKKGVIVQDVLPQAVGQRIGAAYTGGSSGALESVLEDNRSTPNPGLVSGDQENIGILRQYLMYIVRPLRQPAGWLIGGSYRSGALVKVFAEGSLGPNGVAALIDTRHGGVQAVAGPAALRPRLNIKDSKMYRWIEAQQPNAGVWAGPTPMDGVMRIQAYRRIPGRHLLVVAGVDQADWLAPAAAWARGARALAWLASALVIAVFGFVLWSVWKLDIHRRRRFALDQAAIQLNSAHSGLYTAELAGRTGIARLGAVMTASDNGIAVFDADWRLAAWNAPFADSSGLMPEALYAGLPVDQLLRHQASLGLLGPLADPESEIAGRLAQLRAGSGITDLNQLGPDGQNLLVRGSTMPDGGLLFVVTGTLSPARTRLPPDREPEPEPAEAARMEW